LSVCMSYTAPLLLSVSERECCLLVLNLVSSTLSCIRHLYSSRGWNCLDQDVIRAISLSGCLLIFPLESSFSPLAASEALYMKRLRLSTARRPTSAAREPDYGRRAALVCVFITAVPLIKLAVIGGAFSLFR
jgi:hypothetical protein